MKLIRSVEYQGVNLENAPIWETPIPGSPTSVTRTSPAVTTMGGEHAPTGTVTAVAKPATVNVKFVPAATGRVGSFSLQFSIKPVEAPVVPPVVVERWLSMSKPRQRANRM